MYGGGTSGNSSSSRAVPDLSSWLGVSFMHTAWSSLKCCIVSLSCPGEIEGPGTGNIKRTQHKYCSIHAINTVHCGAQRLTKNSRHADQAVAGCLCIACKTHGQETLSHSWEHWGIAKKLYIHT